MNANYYMLMVEQNGCKMGIPIEKISIIREIRCEDNSIKGCIDIVGEKELELIVDDDFCDLIKQFQIKRKIIDEGE